MIFQEKQPDCCRSGASFRGESESGDGRLDSHMSLGGDTSR